MSAHPFLPKTIAIGSASRRVWGCSSTWDRKLWLVGQLLVLPWARVSRSAARVSPRSNRVQRPWERRSSWWNELATFPFQPFATSTPRPRPQRFLHSCSTHIHHYTCPIHLSVQSAHRRSSFRVFRVYLVTPVTHTAISDPTALDWTSTTLERNENSTNSASSFDS